MYCLGARGPEEPEEAGDDDRGQPRERRGHQPAEDRSQVHRR